MIGSMSSSIFALIFAWALPALEDYFGPFGGLAVTVLATWFVCVFLFSIPSAILLRKKELSAMENVPQILLFDDSADQFQFLKAGEDIQ